MATRCIPLSCHMSQDLVKPSFLQPGRAAAGHCPPVEGLCCHTHGVFHCCSGEAAGVERHTCFEAPLVVLKGHTAHLNLTLTVLCVWCLLPFPKSGTLGGSGGVGNREVSLSMWSSDFPLGVMARFTQRRKTDLSP